MPCSFAVQLLHGLSFALFCGVLRRERTAGLGDRAAEAPPFWTRPFRILIGVISGQHGMQNFFPIFITPANGYLLMVAYVIFLRSRKKRDTNSRQSA
jgi:hypothetical protein